MPLMQAVCPRQAKASKRLYTTWQQSSGERDSHTTAGEWRLSRGKAAVPFPCRQGACGAGCRLLRLTSTQLIGTLNKYSNHAFQDG